MSKVNKIPSKIRNFFLLKTERRRNGAFIRSTVLGSKRFKTVQFDSKLQLSV